MDFEIRGQYSRRRTRLAIHADFLTFLHVLFREILAREIRELFLLIDILTTENWIIAKLAKRGRKSVGKEMFTGSADLPLPIPPQFFFFFFFFLLRAFPTISEPGTGYSVSYLHLSVRRVRPVAIFGRHEALGTPHRIG